MLENIARSHHVSSLSILLSRVWLGCFWLTLACYDDMYHPAPTPLRTSASKVLPSAAKAPSPWSRTLIGLFCFLLLTVELWNQLWVIWAERQRRSAATLLISLDQKLARLARLSGTRPSSPTTTKASDTNSAAIELAYLSICSV
ncbi:hypothetical protein IWX90DRAFT_176296 [Phyllosticta citrichinensis]|uniref:Uncharacterized protein n=1 Tax=Phyllosticta citrichinensis TaxID=1130410 RepID=A0ABR1XVF6_9PEZI